MDHIRTEFAKLNIGLNAREIRQMKALVSRFETRGTHPLALNAQVLGVDPVIFREEDRTALFDVFSVKEKDLKVMIKGIPTIDTTFRVSSDAFNLFSIWLVHLSFSLLKGSRQQAFAFDVARYLHYKYFTSLVRHNFPYGSKESQMQATMERLTRKFDITVHGTWKRVIEARCQDLLSKSSIHLKTLKEGRPDDAFLYVVTDTQTRMRDRIRNVVNVYYETRERGLEIRSRGTLREGEDGAYLDERSSRVDTVVMNVTSEISNPRIFIEPKLVRQVASLSTSLTAASLSQVLTRLSQLANTQLRTRRLEVDMARKGKTVTVGIKALVGDIVRATYRHARRSKIPKTNRKAAFIRMKNLYISSRALDEDIVGIKAKMDALLPQIADTRRETTRTALRTAILLYITHKALSR